MTWAQWILLGIVGAAAATLLFLKLRLKSWANKLERTLNEEYPIQKHLEIYGLISMSAWTKRLKADRDALDELQSIEKGLDGNPSLTPEAVQRVLDLGKRHAKFGRILEREYRIQKSHVLRQILFSHVPSPETKSSEWEKLYRRLLEVLATYGKNGYKEDCDFFLLEDEVKEPGHKIEFMHPESLTPALIKDVQAALGGFKNNWYVVIQINVDDLDLDIEQGYIVVWPDHIDTGWDSKRLKELLGERFRLPLWKPG